MFDYLSNFYHQVRENYSHGVTAALGFGGVIQFTDAASHVLGLVAIVVSIACSADKLRRDRQVHRQWLKKAALELANIPGPRLYEPPAPR